MKSRLIVLIVSCFVLGAVSAEDEFDKHCVSCHAQNGISLQKAYMDALLVYGGKENMKAGLAYYLKNPRADTSVMDEEIIKKHGIKEPTSLDDETLDRVLEIYWNRYTVIGKIY